MTNYYKFISRKHANIFTFNKIYKIRDPANLEKFGNFIDDNGHENGFMPTNHLYFEPSTEMEWWIQEGIKINSNTNYLIKLLKKLKIK